MLNWLKGLFRNSHQQSTPPPEPDPVHKPVRDDDKDVNWARIYDIKDAVDHPFSEDVPIPQMDIPLDAIHPQYVEPPSTTDLLNYIVLDFETTGLSPEINTIIEVGIIKVVNGIEVDFFSSFVNPNCTISAQITEITGITNTDVYDAPTDIEIAPQIHQFIGDLPIVAHNANFDISFLKAIYKKAGIDVQITSVDTLALARQTFPDAPNHKLSTLSKWLSLGPEQEHRALSDARLTHALLKECLGRTEIEMHREKSSPVAKLPPNVTNEHCAIAHWIRQILSSSGRPVDMLGFRIRSNKFFRISYFYTAIDIKVGGKSQYAVIEERYINLIDRKLLLPCTKSEGVKNMRLSINSEADLDTLSPVFLAAYDHACRQYQDVKKYLTAKNVQDYWSWCVQIPEKID